MGFGVTVLCLGVVAIFAFLYYAYRIDQSIQSSRRTAQSSRRSVAGFTPGRTVEVDSRTLYSARLGLAGRPDRIVLAGGIPIPEEWKSSTRVYDSHRAQMGVYLILVEEDTGIRPPHGFIVLSNGHRERVNNTPELRSWVLKIAAQIRSAKRQLDREIQANQPAGKCRACGVRGSCGQANG